MAARRVGHRHNLARTILGSRCTFGLALAVAASLLGCGGSSRSTLTEAQLTELGAADGAKVAEQFRTTIGHLLDRVNRQAEAATAEAPSVIDILALTGGGDYGAFGAGLLVGWGKVEDPSLRRPDFDVVTGVSTGALLAPFAYVGTDEACEFVESFYRDPRSDWVTDRGWFFFLPSNPSFMVIPGLERDLRVVIDQKRVAQMAEQSKTGKILAISATNLDLVRQRYWDVGMEAEAAVQSGDPDRIHKIMFASSAIPAAFPPVEIDGFLYADGGVTANVFLRLDPSSPDALIPRWKKQHGDKPLPKVRYWIVVNNQLSQAPKTVQPKWPEIMAPALSVAIRSATIAEMRWLAARADHVNAAYGTDIEVRVSAIPDSWRPPVKGDFQKETMASLSELGRKMGADPTSWRLWASREHPASVPDEIKNPGLGPRTQGPADLPAQPPAPAK